MPGVGIELVDLGNIYIAVLNMWVYHDETLSDELQISYSNCIKQQQHCENSNI